MMSLGGGSLLLAACSVSGRGPVAQLPVKVDTAYRKPAVVSDSIAPEWARIPAGPAIILSIAYADTDNFTHRRLYDCAECLLRPAVAKALYKARDLAAKQGLQILLFDCYRPQSVQLKLYDFLPNKTYVADPTKGSKHSRGCAVDVTLARAGVPLDMGSGFDDMSERAGYGWAGLNETQRAARRQLRDFFTAAGFAPYAGEWWHFSYKACDAPVADYRWPCP